MYNVASDNEKLLLPFQINKTLTFILLAVWLLGQTAENFRNNFQGLFNNLSITDAEQEYLSLFVHICFYLFKGSVIKLTAGIIKEYHCYQLHKKFYLVFFYQG